MIETAELEKLPAIVIVVVGSAKENIDRVGKYMLLKAPKMVTSATKKSGLGFSDKGVINRMEFPKKILAIDSRIDERVLGVCSKHIDVDSVEFCDLSRS
jgi:hypothetical protein